MDEVTLTALKESIEKWEKRAAGEHSERANILSCPLCVLYHEDCRDDGKPCEGCPVLAKTGRDCCHGTPYYDYWHNNTIENAQRELDFLKSLLPPAETNEKPETFGWVDLNYLK